jgi:hypothetical protein
LSGHKVHDNFILDQVSDGMLIGYYTTGDNWIYNNVIARAGLGPDPSDGNNDSHFGVNIDAGHESTGTVIYFYNNTIYACGWSGAAFGAGASGNVCITNTGRYTLKFQNNIICSTGESYVAGWSDATLPKITGNNLWYGKGLSPAWDTTAFNANPAFADSAANNFRLMAGSPAIDKGVNTGIAADFDGVVRPQGIGYDIGAFEYPSGISIEEKLSPAGENILFEASPNPFHPAENLCFRLMSAGTVRIDIYTASGRWVRTLVNGAVNAGGHSAAWDGRDDSSRPMASGAYLFSLKTGGRTLVRRAILMR